MSDKIKKCVFNDHNECPYPSSPCCPVSCKNYLINPFGYIEQPDETPSTAKADKGKARLTLVPRKILFDIARIREYGTEKYGDPDNWKQVEPWRYRDAMMRHMCAYLDDPEGVDEESGLPHLWHLACNVAFLCEMEEMEESKS